MRKNCTRTLLNASADFGDGIVVLRHPLVHTLLPVPASLLNAMYERKSEMLDRALKQAKWGRAMVVHEKPYRLGFLIERQCSIPDGELEELLIKAWATSEFPSDNDAAALIALFRRTGYITDSAGPDRTPPRLPLVVHRGGRPQGMAWTLRLEVAVKFAKRFRNVPGRDSGLWSALAPPHSVLALVTERDEAEVVLDPDLLVDVEELDFGEAEARFGQATIASASA